MAGVKDPEQRIQALITAAHNMGCLSDEVMKQLQGGGDGSGADAGESAQKRELALYQSKLAVIRPGIEAVLGDGFTQLVPKWGGLGPKEQFEQLRAQGSTVRSPQEPLHSRPF